MDLNVILSIVLTILIIILLAMLWFAGIIHNNNKFRTQKEEVFGVDKGLNALIIYQPSRHQTTYNMVMAAVDVFDRNGYKVTVNYPGNGITYNMSDYDIILFGSPVYCGLTSSCINFYLEHCIFGNNKVGLFVTGSSSDQKTDFEEMEKRIPEKVSVEKIKLQKNETENMKKFVSELIG